MVIWHTQGQRYRGVCLRGTNPTLDFSRVFTGFYDCSGFSVKCFFLLRKIRSDMRDTTQYNLRHDKDVLGNKLHLVLLF